MGIPKFFRYISERYPLTSQLIQENRIPEFDNLYLDFNGIIHSCSHPNDEDAHFRLSEEQIFTSIFAYVDHLFGKIKPKKLFFMAVDGVAPRAKMNQQRSRRFRTAKEANDVREKALSRGEKLPDEKAFDSNCITPGTPFMTRLSEQLRYFVNKKITEDSNWRDIEVVLSGHEVPGEGEHKIMEYIRLSRAQPDYNPNVRHCLYGLDADLIMLGLLSHDPHFCLLREEVKFGPAKKKGNSSLESTNFYLLHLSLMREYLDLEFQDIAPALSFDYSLERVIDDFILLAVFVGNDFLPNLPDLHIHENGLERLFDIYKKVLPGLDGYLNESGVINVKRLQVILDEMASWEQEVFEREYSDLNWYKGKQTRTAREEKPKIKQNQSQLVLTQEQRDIFNKVKAFVLTNRRPKAGAESPRLAMENSFPAKDRTFIGNLAKDLHLVLRWDEYDASDTNLVTLRLPELPGGKSKGNDAPASDANGEDGEEKVVTMNGDDDGAEWEDVDDDEDDDEFDEAESHAAVDRVLKKYDRAQVLDPDEGGGFDARHARSIQEKMDEWKRNYYKGKLELSYDNEDEMADLIYTYVEGLQWVMHYYYSGVASWGWFYHYHYAPRISDLKRVDGMTFNFELGTPFRPFEQLMGVLPVASRDHIPQAYQDLMYDPSSSILDFYPLEFELDLNGKKQDWEAIVKIPFIDESRLLGAMKFREHRLSAEENKRNSFGMSTKFSYNSGEPTTYPSSLPGFFPNINRCTCRMEPFDLPTLDGLHLVQGLCDGVVLGKEALAGFPSLNTLPHTASLGFHGVNVHGSESRNKSMVVHITNPHEGKKTEEIARAMVDQRVFFGWPFLHEGLVKAVSDELFKYEMMTVIPTSPQKVISNPHAPHGVYAWRQQAERSEELYSKKTGVVTGPVQVLLHIRPLKGLKPLESGAFVKDYEGMDKEVEHAVQMCLPEVVSEDPRFLERGAPPLAEEFPEGSKLFFLGEHAYGVPGQVSGTTDTTLAVILAFYPNEKDEVEQFLKVVQDRKEDRYFPSFKAADRLGISGRALSKITSSFMVVNSDNQKTNLGLSLKFEAKALKVIDYSRKQNTKYWEFSEKAIQLIKEYKESFPEVFRSLDKGGDAFTHVDEVFTGNDAEARLRDVKAWLKQKGIRDFEPVSLFCDQLSKETIGDIEKLADDLRQSRAGGTYKKAIVKGIPRQAVLKPAHAVYRLQGQKFNIGDRVIMVQDSGAVPLSAKGVVVGLNSTSMDVVWDNSFISGTTLGNKCSQYRGSTVEFNTCLNLTYKQYVRSTKPDAPAQALNMHAASFRPRNGPRPDVQPAPGQAPVAGFRQAPGPKTIMTNPNRGRGRGAGLGHHLNGAPRGAPPNHLNNGGDRGHFSSNSDSHRESPTSPPRQSWNRGGGHNNTSESASHHQSQHQSNGQPRGGQPTPAPLPYRGRGGFTNGTPYPHGGPVLHSGYRPSDNSHVDRARGGPRGRGFRGRGRGGDGFVNSTISPAANGAP